MILEFDLFFKSSSFDFNNKFCIKSILSFSSFSFDLKNSLYFIFSKIILKNILIIIYFSFSLISFSKLLLLILFSFFSKYSYLSIKYFHDLIRILSSTVLK